MAVLPSISRKKILETTLQRQRPQRISEPYIGSVESKQECMLESSGGVEVKSHGAGAEITHHGYQTHSSRQQVEIHSALTSGDQGGPLRKQHPPPPQGFAVSRVTRSISDRQAAVRPPLHIDNNKVHFRD
jgi:hypothetical protein